MIGHSLEQGLKQHGYAVDWVRDDHAASVAWRPVVLIRLVRFLPPRLSQDAS